ncbi:hypothetical protein EDD37DRAFT_439758 [Exophiala viscosa]|uniref:Regulator of phospholipase D SRF1 n=1 Tax=Exophiala viscosa TaxID=2486360 RepID=A0AAN6DRT5_9EURO|nr:hypothetical protein EDD36DRAFT_286733 [Exophiala viscosa]KAI1623776.1 hypothetical protein EDD37DRAFT_439758 [Exophiala viscosa]
MAAPGFPWSTQSRDPEKEAFPPAEDHLVSTREDNEHTNAIKKNSLSGQNNLPKETSNPQGKRRNGSLRGPPRVIPLVTSFTTDTASYKAPRDASTPLPVRTIPAWVRDAEEDDLEDPQFSMPDAPNAALVAQHNHSPANAQRPHISGKQQHGNVTSSGQVRAERTSRWVSFARASAYPRETFNGEKVDTDYLNQHFTDYSKPWLAGHDDDPEDSSSRYRAFRKKRQVWYKRAQFTILRNPFIPLAFRLTIFIFAFVALGLGTSIYHQTSKIIGCIHQSPRTPKCRALVGTGTVEYYQDPSGLMALIVDAIAVAYTLYITHDEYFSKPLGLRRPRAKVRLVLLDLFFVVFQSANLALSFESLTVVEGACKVGDNPLATPKFDDVCRRERVLSGVLLISLVAWLITFSISVLRLVERIGS